MDRSCKVLGPSAPARHTLELLLLGTNEIAAWKFTFAEQYLQLVVESKDRKKQSLALLNALDRYSQPDKNTINVSQIRQSILRE